MTDEGFVWLEESTVTPARTVSLAPQLTAHLTPHLTAHPEPLVRWRASPRRSLTVRLLSVARAAVQGRNAFLDACLHLTDALTAELGRTLHAP